MPNHKCPICYGAKTLTYFTIVNNSHKAGFVTGEDMEQKTIPCEVCHGTGEIDDSTSSDIERLRQVIRTDLRKLITDDPD